MSDDPISLRQGMGTGVAFLAAIALSCAVLVAASIVSEGASATSSRLIGRSV